MTTLCKLTGRAWIRVELEVSVLTQPPHIDLEMALPEATPSWATMYDLKIPMALLPDLQRILENYQEIKRIKGDQ